jgi:hypothetical protein
VILPDVNVLVHAFRDDAPRHKEFKTWLDDVVKSDEALGVSDFVLSGFLRIATHAGIFKPPSAPEEALPFADAFRLLPNAVFLSPGPRHWDIFSRLCRTTNARGNLVPDAYLAALAIESGAELITANRDFARFPGLRWRHPLA